ncbi:MAG: hypothetical protein RR061_08745 [Muribaculaceae bacterium]
MFTLDDDVRDAAEMSSLIDYFRKTVSSEIPMNDSLGYYYVILHDLIHMLDTTFLDTNILSSLLNNDENITLTTLVNRYRDASRGK